MATEAKINFQVLVLAQTSLAEERRILILDHGVVPRDATGFRVVLVTLCQRGKRLGTREKRRTGMINKVRAHVCMAEAGCGMKKNHLGVLLDLLSVVVYVPWFLTFFVVVVAATKQVTGLCIGIIKVSSPGNGNPNSRNHKQQKKLHHVAWLLLRND